jgi:hypothetical protein
MPLLIFKKDRLLVSCFICIILLGCHEGAKQTKLKFESVGSDVYSPGDDYRKALLEWKNYYQLCTNEQLFSDAFYLQLQDKVYIGSINNQHAIDVNKGISLLDTSHNYGNVFNLLSIKNAFNCYDTIALVGNLRTSFYNELVSGLNASPEYKTLTPALDTGQMKIRINTLYTIALIQDKIIELLNTTKDSSLLRFKELLLRPGNVLLAQTVEILGLSADFPLKAKLSPAQREQLTKGIFFNLNNSRDNVGLILLANNNLRVQLNKRYTVLGKFLQLKAS